MAIRVAQVVAEDVIQQTADIRVSQVVVEDVLQQTADIRVAQVVWESVVLSSTNLTISCNNPPAGTVGVPYAHMFLASGGVHPYTFAITVGSLPPGLTLDAALGGIAGTPAVSGVFSFTVQVTDSAAIAPAVASVECSISIAGGGPVAAGGTGCLPHCIKDPCAPVAIESLDVFARVLARGLILFGGRPIDLAGGAGYISKCVDISAGCRKVESMGPENRGGDPAILMALLAMLVVLEGEGL